MKARGEEKIEGKEINKESQVAGKERGRKKGCLLDVRIFYLEHLGTEHSRAQGPWHYLHSATVVTVAAKRSHEILYPGKQQQSSYTA